MDCPSSGEASGGSGNPPQGRAPAGGGDAGPAGNDAISDRDMFRSAVEQLRFVTTMFWQQAGFFLVIQSGLIIVVFQSCMKGELKLLPVLVISGLGLLLALFWGLVAFMRVRIIKYWRDCVIGLDKRPCQFYKNQPWLGRPTSVTMVFPFLLALAWVVLFIIGLWFPTLLTKYC
jgi:hypothetical protein